MPLGLVDVEIKLICRRSYCCTKVIPLKILRSSHRIMTFINYNINKALTVFYGVNFKVDRFFLSVLISDSFISVERNKHDVI